MIQLSEEQRKALQGERGEPVEVVDSATQQQYILLTRKQYERVRSLLEGEAEQVSVASGGAKGGALRQRVQELPLPPEVAAEAERYCLRLGLRGVKNRRPMEEQMKLQHYYGGLWIAELRTNEGPVVVACAESLSDPAFDRQLSFLSAEERRNVVLSSPPRLFDTESEILTRFTNES